MQSDNETLSAEKEKLVEQIEVLQNENKTLQTQVDELAAAAPQNDVTELTDEEQVLQNAVSAYWFNFAHAKDPTSFKVISLRSFEDKIIIEDIGKESYGSYVEYTSLYDPSTDTQEGLGHANEVPNKYKTGADGVAELDIDKVIEFSQGDKCTGYSLWSGRFISREDAMVLLNEESTDEAGSVEKQEEEQEEVSESLDDKEQDLSDEESMSATEEVPTVDSASKETIKLVQEQLNSLGYDCGVADGISGQKTKDAIKSFQADHGLTVTGEIDGVLLEALEDSAVAASDTTMESLPDASNGSILVRDPDAIIESLKSQLGSSYRVEFLKEAEGVIAYGIGNSEETFMLVINTMDEDGKQRVGFMPVKYNDNNLDKLTQDIWALEMCILTAIDPPIDSGTSLVLLDTACTDSSVKYDGFELTYSDLIFTVIY